MPSNGHLFACFCYLTQQYKHATSTPNPWNEETLRYLQSFPDGNSAHGEGLALSIIWPVYNKDNVGHPRFLPVTQMNNTRSLLTRSGMEEAVDTNLQGDYEVFRVMPDYMLESQGIRTFDPSKPGKLNLGTHILVDVLDRSRKEYSVLQPYNEAPIPLYPTRNRIQLPSDNNLIDLTPLNCVNLPGGTVLPDNLQEACRILVGKGAQDALTSLLLLINGKESYQSLVIPQFKLACCQRLKNLDENISDVHPEQNSQILKRLREFKRHPDRFVQMAIRIGPLSMRHIESVKPEIIAYLVEEYDRLIQEQNITRSRPLMMHRLLTHCGQLGKGLHEQCARQMILFVKNTLRSAKPKLDAYLRSIIGLQLNNFDASKQRNEATIMLVNWYFDSKFKLAELSYSMSINSELSSREVHPKDMFKTSNRQPVTFKHLEPDTTYHIWVFNPSIGQWDESNVSEPTFQTDASTTSAQLSLPYNQVYGIAPEGTPGPESFFFINNQHPNAPIEEHPAAMPPALWEQSIQLVPGYEP